MRSRTWVALTRGEEVDLVLCSILAFTALQNNMRGPMHCSPAIVTRICAFQQTQLAELQMAAAPLSVNPASHDSVSELCDGI